MQHIKGCCCYFRQGHFYPLCPPAVSLSSACLAAPLSAGLERQICCFLTRLSAAFDPHLRASFHPSVHSFIFIYFSACTFLCWGAYASVKFLLCVIKCVYATVFCVIVELLLGLSQDYYSVSALLLPFISIFSPSFIQIFIPQSS